MKKPSFTRRESLHFENERYEKKRRLRLFITAAVIFAVVFAGVSFFIMLRANDYNFSRLIGKPGSEEAHSRAPEDVAPEMPEIEGGVNILLAGISGNDVEYTAVIRGDIKNAEISVCPVPADTVVSVSGRSDSLSGHYAYGGSSQLKAAAESAGGIKINRYICITKNGLRDLSKALGGIVIEMPAPISYAGEDFSLNLKQGRQTVSGDTIYKLMMYGEGSARLANQALAITALIDNIVTLDNILEGESFFSSVINCTSSDISAQDYSESERALEYLVKTEKRKPNKVVYELATFKD